MAEESESTKDIRRSVCCQLAEALLHSNSDAKYAKPDILGINISHEISIFVVFWIFLQFSIFYLYQWSFILVISISIFEILEMTSVSSSRRSTSTNSRLSSESPWRPKRANLSGVFTPKNR